MNEFFTDDWVICALALTGKIWVLAQEPHSTPKPEANQCRDKANAGPVVCNGSADRRAAHTHTAIQTSAGTEQRGQIKPRLQSWSVGVENKLLGFGKRFNHV